MNGPVQLPEAVTYLICAIQPIKEEPSLTALSPLFAAGDSLVKEEQIIEEPIKEEPMDDVQSYP